MERLDNIIPNMRLVFFQEKTFQKENHWKHKLINVWKTQTCLERGIVVATDTCTESRNIMNYISTICYRNMGVCKNKFVNFLGSCTRLLNVRWNHLSFAEVLTEFCRNCSDFHEIAGGQWILYFFDNFITLANLTEKSGLASPDLYSFPSFSPYPLADQVDIYVGEGRSCENRSPDDQAQSLGRRSLHMDL